MTITQTPADTFRVWIGCLACYNDGRLIGDWHDADTAGEVTTRDLHAAAGITTDDAGNVLGAEVYGPHEELWCLDIDNAPEGYAREMSPCEAQAIAEKLAELEEEERDPFAVWCANNGETLTTADPEDFRESFAGVRDSWRDYADEIADEMIAQCVAAARDPYAYPKPAEGEGPADWLAGYFDYDAYARDLAGDYWTHDAPSGVYVFRSF